MTRTENENEYVHAVNPGRTVAQVTRLVRSTVAVRSPTDDAKLDTLVTHIMNTGDCVWHAVHVVCHTARCYCADCEGA